MQYAINNAPLVTYVHEEAFLVSYFYQCMSAMWPYIGC